MRRVSSLRGCHRQRRAASLTRQALCAHPPTFGDDLKHLNLGERDHARLCVWNWCVGSQPCYSIAAFSLAAALRLAMGRRRGRCAISICGSGSAAGIVLFCARLFVPAGLGSAQARHDAISAHLSLIFLARRDLLRAHVLVQFIYINDDDDDDDDDDEAPAAPLRTKWRPAPLQARAAR